MDILVQLNAQNVTYSNVQGTIGIDRLQAVAFDIGYSVSIEFGAC